MDRIIMPTNNIIEELAENRDVQYAAKHQIESHLGFHGIWQCDQYRDGVLISGGYPEPPNTFCTAGMARMLNIILHDIAKSAANMWYVGIFKTNITPAVGDTVAKLGNGNAWGECQDADYDSPATNKPVYNPADTATATITNAASKAEFTIAATITVYGAFLSSVAAKTATSGYLLAGKKFTASRAVIDNDELAVTYIVAATTS